MWVLCLSAECHEAVEKLHWPDLIPIRLTDFENGDAELHIAKANRTTVEYYFTCTPSLPLWILRRNPEVDVITYLDSDLFFFNSPEPVFNEMSDGSIAIIEHRFDPGLKDMERTGIYNVGWLSFRNNEEGLRCLNWCRDRCLEWCHDYVEADRYADQKYLDRFPELFSSVKVITHKGANVAAWNLKNYTLRENEGVLYIDGDPLLFYHFQGLRRIAPGVIDPGVRQYGLRVTSFMQRNLFKPYLEKLSGTQQLLSQVSRQESVFSALHRKLNKNDKGTASNPLRRLARFLAAYYRILTGHFLLHRNPFK